MRPPVGVFWQGWKFAAVSLIWQWFEGFTSVMRLAQIVKALQQLSLRLFFPIGSCAFYGWDDILNGGWRKCTLKTKYCKGFSQ